MTYCIHHFAVTIDQLYFYYSYLKGSFALKYLNMFTLSCPVVPLAIIMVADKNKKNCSIREKYN
jgi:hypothetical protein